MKCPMGNDDHPVTWRCFVVYGVDWLVERWPETWPMWTYRPLYWILARVDLERNA